jgi:hypothetical protein
VGETLGGAGHVVLLIVVMVSWACSRLQTQAHTWIMSSFLYVSHTSVECFKEKVRVDLRTDHLLCLDDSSCSRLVLLYLGVYLLSFFPSFYVFNILKSNTVQMLWLVLKRIQIF